MVRKVGEKWKLILLSPGYPQWGNVPTLEVTDSKGRGISEEGLEDSEESEESSGDKSGVETPISMESVAAKESEKPLIGRDELESGKHEFD